MSIVMTEESKQKDLPCSKCGSSTSHDIKASYFKNGGNEDLDENYMIVQCRGCKKISFCSIVYHYDHVYPHSYTEWGEPEMERIEDVNIYPRFIEGHCELDGLSNVPSSVRDVYNESLIAIREGAKNLSCIGLRKTIEVICNDLKIEDKCLDAKINKLADRYIISQGEKRYLREVQFWGNDAAHTTRKLGDEQIRTILKIIEHLIDSVYVIDAETKENLNTVVTEFEDFKRVLVECLKGYSCGEEYPLEKFFGKEYRRVKDCYQKFEGQLIAEIQAGDFVELTIGKKKGHFILNK